MSPEYFATNWARTGQDWTGDMNVNEAFSEAEEAIPPIDQPEGDRAQYVARYLRLQQHATNLESLVAALQIRCRELENQVTVAQSRYHDLKSSQVTMEQVIVEYGRQQDEIERLERALTRQRRQAMAASSILQGSWPLDRENSEATTIHDLES